MGARGIDAVAWQESWDRQQEAYLPDREERFGALLDVVEVVTDGSPAAVLDLASGPGSISLRTLRRFPHASVTLLDIDPVLLAIARASLDERATVAVADLRASNWVEVLPHRDYDAVLTATALHWIALERLADLYGEIRQVLRPGGVFVNVDYMPDDGLPGLTEMMGQRERARWAARLSVGADLPWEAWWGQVGKDPSLGPLLEHRQSIFAEDHPTEHTPRISWHLDALRSAGYKQAGSIWRRSRDAAVAGIR